MPSTFSSMHSRNFRLFFSGQFISQVGNWLTLLAQTLLVLHLTDNGLAVGLLGAAQFGPVLLMGAFAGLIADRADKRRLLVITQSLAMLQSGALAVIAFMPNTPLLGVYALAFIGGIITAFDNPARRAFVVEMVPESNVNNAVSLNSAMMTGSRVIGPALAGVLVSSVGFGWCFAVDGLSYIAVIGGLLAMRSSELRRPPVAVRGPGQVREGIRYVRSVPELWLVVVMMAIVGTFSFNFSTVMPLFVTRTLHGSDMEFTLLFSVISLGSLTGALVMARRTSVSLVHMQVASAVFGTAMCALSLVPDLAVSFPMAFMVGVSSIAFMTSSTAIVQFRSDPAMRGRVLALQTLVFLGSTPIGGPLLGGLIDLTNARVGLAAGGVAALGAALYGRTKTKSSGISYQHQITTTLPPLPVPKGQVSGAF